MVNADRVSNGTGADDEAGAGDGTELAMVQSWCLSDVSAGNGIDAEDDLELDVALLLEMAWTSQWHWMLEEA